MSFPAHLSVRPAHAAHWLEDTAGSGRDGLLRCPCGGERSTKQRPRTSASSAGSSPEDAGLDPARRAGSAEGMRGRSTESVQATHITGTLYLRTCPHSYSIIVRSDTRTCSDTFR